MEVERLDGAGEAIERLAGPLRKAGAEGELSYGILRRLVDDPGAWGDEVTILIGTGAEGPVGLVTMTGTFPALIVGFGEAGAVDVGAFADAMVDMGRRPTAVNGARRWSEPFAEAWQTLGADVHPSRDMRAFELTRVRPPRDPGGQARLATEADRPLLERWVVSFGDDIGEPVTREDAAISVSRLLAGEDAVVWRVDDEPVSLAAIVRRTPLSSTVAYVYTPPELRGRGYASAVVAHISQRELDAGAAWCSLFTDLANPTSNHIYAEIGYEPRADFRLFELAWPVL